MISLTCSSFSGTANFEITFTIHHISDDSEVTSIVDLGDGMGNVYGKIMITDDAGVQQSLDVHLRRVVADIDDTPGGFYEYLLIEDG